jgi:hypothetical protein
LARRQQHTDDDSLIGELFLLAWERPGVGTIAALLMLLIAGIFHDMRLVIPNLAMDVAPPLTWLFLGVAGITLVGTIPGWMHICIRALMGSTGPAPAPDIETAELPYSRAAILSDGEKAFYDVLISVLPNERTSVLLKVRLADLLHIPDDVPRYKSWFGRVAQKHVDFVLCDKLTVIPYLAIELDDRSHERADRASSDRLKDIVLPHVGIPLERIKCQTAYDVTALEELIARYAPVPPVANGSRKQR